MRTHLALPLLLAALSAPAAAQSFLPTEVVLRVTGEVETLVNGGTQVGVFAGAAVGDPFELLLGVTSTTTGPTTTEGHYVSPDRRGRLTIGSAERPSMDVAQQLTLWNDQPSTSMTPVDQIHAVLFFQGNHIFSFWGLDETGAFLPSADIGALGGPYPFQPEQYALLGRGSGTFRGLRILLHDFEVVHASAVGAGSCASVAPNSTGAPATLDAVGFDYELADRLSLVAGDLPPVTTVLPLAGRSVSAPLPVAGSQGLLCLGGPLGRFNGLVGTSDATGAFEVEVDLDAIPMPSGTAPVLVGETWAFQAWYRDAIGGAQTSNFTDATQVTFR